SDIILDDIYELEIASYGLLIWTIPFYLVMQLSTNYEENGKIFINVPTEIFFTDKTKGFSGSGSPIYLNIKSKNTIKYEIILLNFYYNEKIRSHIRENMEAFDTTIKRYVKKDFINTREILLPVVSFSSGFFLRMNNQFENIILSFNSQ